MKACRVFVMYKYPLFARGVLSLLRQVEDLEIVGVESDFQKALAGIRALQPDVVIVDSKDASPSLPADLPIILRDSPKVRVINLHFGDNGMDIYDGQQVIATKPEDLIAAIRSVRDEGAGRMEELSP